MPRPRRRDRRRAERYGRMAESLAALLLQMKGYRILERRYKTPLGEVDLIVRRGRVIAFVEVKARGEAADPLYGLTPQQRRRNARAALAYLMRRPEIAECDLRFDLVLLRGARLPRHIPNAWSLDEAGLA